MMKGFRLLIICLLVSWTNILSQQLSHQVLVPLAGIISGNNLNYTQTVGETAVDIFGCSEYFFTQGFQQPGIKMSSEIPPPGSGIKVYPNPVSDYLIIELFGESPRTFRIEIINIAGTVVISEKKTFSGRYWYKEPQNIENLFRGFYVVRIMSEDKVINRIFKIEKL